MYRGRLVTFEGPEGSGKTTIVNEVTSFLKSTLPIKIVSLREPGGTQIGDQIREILHDNRNTEMCGKAEALLYQASRAQIICEQIRPYLAEGAIVILDRFRDSTIAYQGYARGLGCYTVDLLNNFSTGGLIPDRTYLMDVPVEIGLARRKKNNQEMNRLDNERIEFHKKVREAYLTLYANDVEGRWEYINANRDYEEVLAEVKSSILTYLTSESFVERKLSFKER